MSLTALDLLSAALDNSGHIVIVGLKEGAPPIQRYFAPADYQGAVDEAMQLDSNGYNAYFATSTFITDRSRKAENAQSVKTFKLDLDIAADDDKKYPSQAAAAGALKEFCTKYNFPRPTLVLSGYGLHAYWIVDQALDGIEGRLLSEKLKQLCLKHKLKIDRTVTADVARILRVPDTHNYKNPDDPRLVELVGDSIDIIPQETFVDLLSAAYAASGVQEEAGELPAPFLGRLPEHLQGVELDEVQRKILHRPKSAAILFRKSKAGEGCGQIKDMLENQILQDEPRWRAGLSVVWACEDGPTAIHEFSNQHPGYDFDQTVRKAEGTAGPWRCVKFIENWPEQCEGCKHRGQITSPIQLGEFVRKASAGDNVVVGFNKSATAQVSYIIPDYPFPYFRADGGGVFRRIPDDDDGGEEIFDKDFYLVERLRDEVEGYIMHFRLHHPNDGVLDFTLHTADYSSPDLLRSCLSKYGILLPSKKALENMRHYIETWYHTLEQRKEVATVKTQFGWTDKTCSSFVIGDREITGPGSEKYSPTAPSLAPISKLFHREGDFLTWKKVVDVYDRPGLEHHALTVLTGFASPLMAMTGLGHKGVMINAYSQESGSGKSTALAVAMSVWGDTDGLMLSYKDTALARFNRMGIYQNLPVAVDEITKMSEADMSDFLFAATQGRGRHRLTSSAMEKVNTITWQTMIACSSNTSFVEVLQADKSGVQGELMRLFEIPIPDIKVMDKEEADEIFGLLTNNYGFAGEMFIEHILQDPVRVRRMLSESMKAIDKEAGLTSRERYWSSAAACLEVAGRLAVEAGCISWDMARIRVALIKLLHLMKGRVSVTLAPQAKGNVLSEFLNEHTRDTLVVKEDQTNLGNYIALQEPSGQLLVRHEHDKGIVYVTQTHFKRFMKDRNINLDAFLDEMIAAGRLLDPSKDGSFKRLASGTLQAGGNTRVFSFKV